jgi:hypothetical protein
LPSKKRITGCDFVWFGVAILRRATFENVADVDILTFDINGFNDLCKKLAGASDERKTLLVFVVAGSFTHEYEVRVRVAGTENDMGPRRSEFAPLAIADVEPD